MDHHVPYPRGLGEGLALPNLSAFFDTQAGHSYAQIDVRIFRMLASSFAWCPFGWLAIPIATDNIDAAREKSGKETLERLGLFANFNPPMEEWAKTLPPQPWAAIQDLNTEYFQRVSGKRAWQTCAAFFSSFAAKVAPTTWGMLSILEYGKGEGGLMSIGRLWA